MITQFPFPYPNEERGYRLFPEKLEADEHIVFHGTAAANLQSIIDHGFKPGPALVTISFARTSEIALSYACKARSAQSPSGCVLAVRFDSLRVPGVAHEIDCILVHQKLGPKPTVVGYCEIPADYRFV